MTLKRLRAIVTALMLTANTLSGMNLSQAETVLQSNKQSEIFQAYDTFKSAYMDATVEGDAAKKRRALEGIVASGNKLHIDVSDYRNKLKTLPAPAADVKPAPVAEPVAKPEPASKGRAKAPSIKGQNRLEEVEWDSGNLVFRFEKTLSNKDVNFFKLKKSGKHGYRYVLDIHAVLDESHTLTHRDLKRISLTQYKPQTIRLVLESSKALPVRFAKAEKTLTVRAGLSGVTSPKHVPVTSPGQARNKERVIVIDPGHGGKDGGAVGHNRYKEKEIVLSLAAKMASRLRERGYTVYMTRSKDKFIKLRNRTGYANKKKADLFISLHANAVPKSKARKAYGIETYFLSPSRSKRATNAAALENKAEVEDMDFYGKSTFLNVLNSEKIVASHKLAIDLQSSVLSSLRARYKEVKDAGVREGPFWVLVGAQMPAVLVEIGFITHPKEAVRIHSNTYQDYFARGLAEGVERYFAKNR
ncbi:N-acetylmuramoyl-L-alanine amidase [Sulfurimonas sp. HSL-3221]|uniref:N-acetylmuramoyl-L-alanine amidase family protein n=1 Tax=Sulfurimonadaceae TaxID=2771471 RepID=UPI001E377E75|nr:N-acetylmuramoyl-L-alanine amidase [Sulfurimonas sp. HSL-3221]UFS62059.1 N-acetylmuramoyl-L-alanine amidase [Sulfurimonas sp. HSL-3221]